MHILPVCPGACFYCSFHLMLDLGYNFVVKISTKGVGGQWFCRTIYTYFNGIHSIMLFTMKFEISKHNYLKKKSVWGNISCLVGSYDSISSTTSASSIRVTKSSINLKAKLPIIHLLGQMTC